MAHSLEVREPLMDHELISGWHLAQPPKIDGSEGKALLKRAMGPAAARRALPAQDGLLGAAGRCARPWRAAKAVLGDRLRDSGYFQERQLQRLVDEHQRGTSDHATPLWMLVMFDLPAARAEPGGQTVNAARPPEGVRTAAQKRGGVPMNAGRAACGCCTWSTDSTSAGWKTSSCSSSTACRPSASSVVLSLTTVSDFRQARGARGRALHRARQAAGPRAQAVPAIWRLLREIRPDVLHSCNLARSRWCPWPGRGVPWRVPSSTAGTRDPRARAPSTWLRRAYAFREPLRVRLGRPGPLPRRGRGRAGGPTPPDRQRADTRRFSPGPAPAIGVAPRARPPLAGGHRGPAHDGEEPAAAGARLRALRRAAELAARGAGPGEGAACAPGRARARQAACAPGAKAGCAQRRGPPSALDVFDAAFRPKAPRCDAEGGMASAHPCSPRPWVARPTCSEDGVSGLRCPRMTKPPWPGPNLRRRSLPRAWPERARGAEQHYADRRNAALFAGAAAPRLQVA